MADANIVLRIGSALGPGGMASLQAGIGMVAQLGRKVADTIKEVEQFGQVYRNLEIDISKADSSTKGLIDTLELMKQANQFTAAQMNLTGDELDAVARLSANYAQKTGKDITTSFKQLSEAIQKGQTRALKEYGLNLKTSTDLIETQKGALDLVMKAAKGVTVEVETLTETMYAMNNNFGTSLGLIGNMKVGFDGLYGSGTSLNEQWAEFNSGLSDTIKIGGSLEGVLREVYIGFMDLGAEGSVMQQAADRMRDIQDAAFDAGLEIKRLQGLIKSQKQANFDEALRQLEEEGMSVSRESVAAAAKREGAEVDLSKYKSSVSAKTKTKRSGGGKGKSKSVEMDSMEFTLEDVAQFEQDQTDDLLGNISKTAREEADRDLALRNAGEGIGDAKLAQTTPEEAKALYDEMMEKRAELEEQKQIQHEEEMRRAEEWGDAWSKTFYDVSSMAAETNGQFSALSKGALAMGAALEASSKGGAAAVEAGTLAIVEGTQWEAAVKAAMEYAKMLSSYASQDYLGGTMHLAAAVAYTAVAAQSATAKKPSGSSRRNSNRGSSGDAGGFQPTSGGAERKESEPQKVIIQMKEDGWEAIVRKNEKEINDGRRGFDEAQ